MENSNTAVIGHSVSTGGCASLVLGCFQREKMKVVDFCHFTYKQELFIVPDSYKKERIHRA